jgi:hypothetical protein
MRPIAKGVFICDLPNANLTHIVCDENELSLNARDERLLWARRIKACSCESAI